MTLNLPNNNLFRILILLPCQTRRSLSVIHRILYAIVKNNARVRYSASEQAGQTSPQPRLRQEIKKVTVTFGTVLAVLHSFLPPSEGYCTKHALTARSPTEFAVLVSLVTNPLPLLVFNRPPETLPTLLFSAPSLVATYTANVQYQGYTTHIYIYK